MFGIVVVPITFLGCVYYPWAMLTNVRWLQILVLINPAGLHERRIALHADAQLAAHAGMDVVSRADYLPGCSGMDRRAGISAARSDLSSAVVNRQRATQFLPHLITSLHHVLGQRTFFRRPRGSG